ncbi:MAG: RNA polymerase sigma factor [Phycisphaeraceae bacterium]|nr:RNA polymerase sigma factor [Phycisphaeraceae bacterium]
MASVEEDQLAKLAAQGNHKALAELLARFEDRVYSVCYRMTRHPDDALDMAQQTMLKVIQNITQFQNNASIGTWIYRIATHESISHLRKQQVRKTMSLDQPASSTQNSPRPANLGSMIVDSRELSADLHVQKMETKRLLREALTQLDTDHRMVLVLRDTQQMNYQQIGEILELPEGTVKSRLFRARLALREKMLQLDPESSAPGSLENHASGNRDRKSSSTTSNTGKAPS